MMDATPHLLVVDDDKGIRELLTDILARYGFRVTTAGDAKDMRRVLEEARIDLVVLDVMLPGEDGLAACRALRATTGVPVIMLTAMGETMDRVVGLEVGADDYLPKPFDARELVARIRAVLRRSRGVPERVGGEEERVLRFAGWTLNLVRRRLESPRGVAVELTSGEFDLLAVLAERPQRVLSRDQLIDLARGRDAAPFDRSIDVQVSRLRRKLGAESGSDQLIQTIRGGGYMFAAEVERT